MGMCAEVIAIGPYSTQIAHVLDYRADSYAKTMEGAVITRKLFGVVQGSSVSREFAAILGVSDTWDFNQHNFDAGNVDLAALQEFGTRYEYQEDVEAFRVLRDAGFKFHFRPEG